MLPLFIEYPFVILVPRHKAQLWALMLMGLASQAAWRGQECSPAIAESTAHTLVGR